MYRRRGRVCSTTLLGMFMWATIITASATITAVDFDTPHMALPGLPSIEDLMDSVPDQPFETLADVDAFMTSLMDLADLYLEKAFTAHTHRYKRALDVTSVTVTGTQIYNFNFFNPTEFNAASLERVSGRQLLATPEKVYWILGYPRSGWQSVIEMSRLDYRIKLLAKFRLESIAIDKIDRITGGFNMGLMWMALGSASSSLVTIACVNMKTGRWVITQEITVQGELRALNMFMVNKQLFLAVGAQANFVVDSDVVLYVLIDNYFDRRDDVQLKMKGVQDITGFTDSKSFYYLVFGSGPQEGGLQVYQFDMLVDSISLIQVLPDNVMQMLHFVDYHDGTNYILIIDTNAFTKIYRWSNQQLKEWQTLQTEGGFGPCCSVGFLTLENLENLIFISQGGKITLYSDDMTGHYFPTFTIDTGCHTVQDLRGMKMGPDYVITYICLGVDGTAISLQARSLILEELKLAELETTADDLLHCLDKADMLLDSRKPNITYLADLTISGSMMTVNGPQTWTGLVTFSRGLTVTGTTTFNNRVDIKPSGNIVPTSGSLAKLFSDIDDLKSSVEDLAEDLDNLLYHSGDQTINGPITASTLTADKLEIDVLQIQKVNGIPLTSFVEVFMIDGLDQTITSEFAVTKITADSFTTRNQFPTGTINGIRTNEYMRKSVGEQKVTGDHKYTSIVSGNIIHAVDERRPILFNGIDSSTIVRKGKNVTFHDHKDFNNLIIVGHANAGLLNNVDMSRLTSRVVYTDTTQQQTLSGVYSLASVQVDGNIDVSNINGVNLRNLESTVVKSTGDFTLQGPVMYTESLTVAGNLLATTINGVEWDDLLDLDSPNLVSTNYYFVNAVVTDVVRSNNINGLDLSEDVVVVDTQQSITGRVTFMTDVEVTGARGVVMEDGGTVNGIDPSQLYLKTDSLVNLIIDEEVHLNGPLKCTGDVVATTVNGLVLDAIEDRYWRRSVNQNIGVGLHINRAEFRGPVTGITINGNNMADFLHTSGFQYIIGHYTFKGPVVVEGNLEMEAYKTVDGVDVSELDKNVVKLFGEETIEGFINFSGSIMVVGDLVLTGLLNGLRIPSDLMLLDHALSHTGHLVFRNDVVVTGITLSSNLMVDTINGMDVEAAASQLVLDDENSTVIGDLQFTGDVNVQYLGVSGTVDGINLNSVVERALKKSSVNQVVTGRITVKSVHFSQGPALNMVNNNDWTAHLTNVVLQDYNGIIRGVKTFHQALKIGGNFDPVTINGINVADLARRILSRSTEQTVFSHYTFSNSVNAIDVSADIIDGIDVTDLLLINEVGYVGGTVTFANNVTFLGGLNSTTGVLDGCDVLKANEHAIWKSEKGGTSLNLPVVIGKLTITGSATASGSILADSINMDIMHFLATLVLKSSDQEITGEVEFLRDVDIQQLHVEMIDGVDIDALFRLSVLDNVDTVIKCNLDFTKTLSVGSLTVITALSGIGGTGGVLVNGVDVSDIAARAVLATGGTFIITGRKTFIHGFHTHHLVVTGFLGGVRVSDLVVFSSGDIINDVIFTGSLTIRGNLMVSGLVDGVDLAHLFTTRMTLDQNQTFYGNWRFEAIRVEGDLEVEQINDVVVSNLVVKYGRASQEITGHKILTGGLHVLGKIQTVLLNGLDILQINNTIVRKDKDATIAGVVTFEYVVRARKSVVVVHTVNGFDLSELNYNLSPLKRIIDEQYQRIDRLRSLLASFRVTNLPTERIFELAYLEKLEFIILPHAGHLWFGVNHNLESLGYLSVRSRGGPCLCCTPATSFFQVNEDAGIAGEPTLHSSGAVFILHHTTEKLQITLNRRCTDGIPTFITVDTTTKPQMNIITATVNIGVVTDAGMFVDNGIAYIVTVAGLDHASNVVGTTIIHTIMVDLTLRQVVVAWSKETHSSASKLDLTLIKGMWYLLVANEFRSDNVVDPYRATSELYVWKSGKREFQLKGEYLADYVTTGIFIKSPLPVEENFISLAQLKAADFPVLEDNLKYTTKVLIFRYNEETENFEEFECLPSFGVVDQVTFIVDCTLYLLLLSEKGTLHVYKYHHPEGFRLYQTILIKDAYALAIVKIHSGTYVVVSIWYPPGVLVLRAKIKGIKPYSLLE
ncbi:uncharacterized protein LOC121863747 [Homarus americanus]|uniref:uncharacterized protein LOC121863747 n=1 Tax=Homarus americanus TaxID=6706 RepID=UPI001C44BA0C|nr:uncharacterized protein LOC121863747 [Homarus americanus]